MRTFRKSLIFCLLVIAVGLALNFTMIPSSGLRVVLHEVQDKEINYDLIVVGQSHGETNIDPYILEEETGLTSYNLSRRLLSMQDLYYLVKESNYRNHPEVIIMDIDYTYWVGEGYTNYFNDSYVYHHLNNPANKLEYFLRYALQNDYRVTLCPYIDVKTGLTSIVSTIKNKLSPQYRAYSMEAVEMPGDLFTYKGRGFRYATDHSEAVYDIEDFDPEKVSETALESFKEIVKYCKKENIRLVCISSPLPKSRLVSGNYERAFEYYQALTAEYDVEYIDFNIDPPDGLTWDEEEFMDNDGHMMGYFAEKFSEELGEKLNQK